MIYSLGAVSIDPGKNYWKDIKTINKYLRNTKDRSLIYGESNLKHIEFTNSNFQSDHDDSKSMSRYIYNLNDGAVY